MEVGTVFIENAVLLAEAERMLAEGLSVKLTPTGRSMLPFIVGGRDEVILTKPSADNPLRKGQIALARLDGGKYVLHRILSLQKREGGEPEPAEHPDGELVGGAMGESVGGLAGQEMMEPMGEPAGWQTGNPAVELVGRLTGELEGDLIGGQSCVPEGDVSEVQFGEPMEHLERDLGGGQPLYDVVLMGDGNLRQRERCPAENIVG
ncbi:MAG: S24/S26 family peptidase, partial [Bacteroidales bacterium]|nr:S24/S26 family peptidase [Bacteroidales bacterium]